MIPDNKLSDIPHIGAFLAPNDRRPGKVWRDGIEILVDYELGGIGLGDTSQGLQVKSWEFRATDSEISVASLDGLANEPLLTVHGTTDLAGAFDSNMFPVVAYTQSNATKLWWYDGIVGSHVTTDIQGARSPRLTLDDKRQMQDQSRDVLLFYLKGGLLCYRQQRDKYDTERILGSAPFWTHRLGRVGMSSVGRVQIELLSNP